MVVISSKDQVLTFGPLLNIHEPYLLFLCLYEYILKPEYISLSYSQYIFLQSRFEEKTYKEIAVEMNTTPKAVERQMAKTMAYLKKHISMHYNAIIVFYFLIDSIKK